MNITATESYGVPMSDKSWQGQQGYSEPTFDALQGEFVQGGAPMQGGMPAAQPDEIVWITPPEPILGCPPGLEYLTQIDQLLIQQQIEMLEVVSNWESANKYRIFNSANQQIYFAAEESDMATRQFSGPNRGFVMHITDNMGQEVTRVTRESKDCAPCCWFGNTEMCGNEVTVEAPPGNVVGYVREQHGCCSQHFSIQDANHETVLQIKGPCILFRGFCCISDDFVVFSRDLQDEVGKINKQWGDRFREVFTDAQNFSITFPLDLDVKIKAVMMGALFLIDFMFFERSRAYK